MIIDEIDIDISVYETYQVPSNYIITHVVDMFDYEKGVDDLYYLSNIKKSFTEEGIKLQVFVRYHLEEDLTLIFMSNVPKDVKLSYYKDCLIKGKEYLTENIKGTLYESFISQTIITAINSDNAWLYESKN